MANGRQLLLIAKAGPVAEGLIAILTATDGLQVSATIDHVPTPSDPPVAGGASEVLLDCGPLDLDVANMVAMVRRLWPRAKCVVLADNVGQQGAAEKAGADAALVRGCQPEDLIATVEQLLGHSRGS